MNNSTKRQNPLALDIKLDTPEDFFRESEKYYSPVLFSYQCQIELYPDKQPNYHFFCSDLVKSVQLYLKGLIYQRKISHPILTKEYFRFYPLFNLSFLLFLTGSKPFLEQNAPFDVYVSFATLNQVNFKTWTYSDVTNQQFFEDVIKSYDIFMKWIKNHAVE